jgi:hypothetical protein
LPESFVQARARWRFDRRQGGITGVRDESAFRLGLDAVGELRYYALEFHDALRDCSANLLMGLKELLEWAQTPLHANL